MTRYAMSARTLREGASVASVPFRETLKGPKRHTATEERDASRTSFESNANSHVNHPSDNVDPAVLDKFLASSHAGAHADSHAAIRSYPNVPDGARPIQRTLIDFITADIAEAAWGSSRPARGRTTKKNITKQVDAMQLSKDLSSTVVCFSPQGRKKISGEILNPNREEIRASVRVEPGVIKILEDILDEARRGETIAGAIVLVRPNATVCSAISAPNGGRHHLIAACDYLKKEIIAETDN